MWSYQLEKKKGERRSHKGYIQQDEWGMRLGQIHYHPVCR